MENNIDGLKNDMPNYVKQIAARSIEDSMRLIEQNSLSQFRNIGVLDLRTEKYEEN